MVVVVVVVILASWQVYKRCWNLLHHKTHGYIIVFSHYLWKQK